MKFLLAFALVAVASAIPMPGPESIQLPAADQPEIMEAPGFFKPSIEPVFIDPEVAAEFYKSFEVNPPMEYVHVLAYMPEEPQPINFVDVAENAETFVPYGDIQPIVFLDSVIPPRQARAPLNSEVAEVAEEIVPVPVSFVDDAESVAADEIAPVPVNFVDGESVAAEEIAPVPVNFVNDAESVAAEEVAPVPVNFVNEAEPVAAEAVAPVPVNFVHEESVAAEEIVPVKFVDSAPEIVGTPVLFVDNAEVQPFKESAVAAEIQPEPVNFVDAPLYDVDQDIASMLR